MKGLFLVLLLALAGCATIEPRLQGASTPQAIAQAAADFYVIDAADESCAVAIVSPKGTVFASAGSANERSLFRIASLSKLFLHPVLDRLAAEGRLDLDRSVRASTKLDLPREYEQVTLRDLLLNRSGLPREFMIPGEPVDTFWFLWCCLTGSDIYKDFEERESFARCARRPWWRWHLRHRHEDYSNVGFGLLGMAVEDTLGEDLEALVAKELVKPLGLEETTYAPCGACTGRVTRACAGHTPWLVRRGRNVPDHRLGPALRAAGGLFSSARDCAKVFAAAWPTIEAEMRARSLAACEEGDVYGLLRVHVQPSGRRVLYRSGMIWGGASFVGFDPATRTIVIILRNVTSWPDKRGFAILEKLEL